MKIFRSKTRHFYAEVPDFRARLLTVCGMLLIGWWLVEFLCASTLNLYPNAYLEIGIFSVILLIFIFAVANDKGSKKQWAYSITFFGLLIASYIDYRLVQNLFNPIFTFQLIAIILALSFLFDRKIQALIFGIGLFLLYAITLIFVENFNQNGLLFVLAIPFSLLFLAYSLHTKLHRLSILEFSESVLGQYDKFVFIYDQTGEVIYMNDFASKSLNFDKKGYQFEEWWGLCGYSNEEIISQKKHIQEALLKDEFVPPYEQVLYPSNLEPIIIDWHVQLIRQQFYIAIGNDITIQRKENLEATRLSKVSKALEAGVTTTNALGQITWCNSSYAQIFEYSEEELIGKRPSQIFGVPPFFIEKYDELLKNGISLGQAVELPHYTKSGRLIWILLNSSKIEDDEGNFLEGIEVITDITQQKNAEFQFRQTSLIVERTQTPVLITDLDMTINWMNDALLNEFQLCFDDVIGESFGDRFLVKNQSLEILNIVSETIANHSSIHLELLLNRRNVEEWYKISLDPVQNENNDITQYLIVMHNIQSLKMQQAIIEQKNKDMVSSISYAKRIQSAFLPTSKTLNEEMPCHFFYYRPKDIVSGDFYYVKRSGPYLFIAIADCTGHGVPGAMITSIAAASLNNAIFDHHLTLPSEILEHADLYVKQALSANVDDLTDGMDIGLIVLDFERCEFRYSGARRPLIMMKNGQQHILRADKRSIGEFQSEDIDKFTEWSFPVDDEYGLYLFSDGIHDQFGGVRQKKIGLKRLLDFISSFNELSPDEMLEEFEKQMEEWTENFSIVQTDDMVFFGTKINPNFMIEKRNKWVKNES